MLLETNAEVYLVGCCKDALCGCSAHFYGVCAICQDLRLYNGHQAILLADAGVAGQAVGILVDCERGRGARADLEHSAPLGKARALLVVLGAPLAQVIKALQRKLSDMLCSSEASHIYSTFRYLESHSTQHIFLGMAATLRQASALSMQRAG